VQWHEPILFPSAPIGDPRLKPRHLSFLAAVHHLATADFYLGVQIRNSDLMRRARISDHETFYKYRFDLDRIGYLSFAFWEGFATEYDLDRGDLAIPVGLLTDRHIATPGAIALYLALTALASRTNLTDQLYGTSCQATNRELQDAARFTSRGQLRRYRNELEDAGLITITRTASRPPTYNLTLNQAANAHLQTEATTLTY